MKSDRKREINLSIDIDRSRYPKVERYGESSSERMNERSRQCTRERERDSVNHWW